MPVHTFSQSLSRPVRTARGLGLIGLVLGAALGYGCVYDPPTETVEPPAPVEPIVAEPEPAPPPAPVEPPAHETVLDHIENTAGNLNNLGVRNREDTEEQPSN